MVIIFHIANLFDDFNISKISQQEFERNNFEGDFISLNNHQMKNKKSIYVLIYQLKSYTKVFSFLFLYE
jgi:hypothetical protein